MVDGAEYLEVLDDGWWRVPGRNGWWRVMVAERETWWRMDSTWKYSRISRCTGCRRVTGSIGRRLMASSRKYLMLAGGKCK
jgi:hypothetical protein